MQTQDKIYTLETIGPIVKKLQGEGKRVVQCHGVFDLLHPGHIRHFEEARQQGDVLVVTVTPDRFVNKGPGRPAFKESLRLESLAALSCVDYVVLNETPTAVGAIYSVKPNIYVKGVEYKEHSKDITGKIREEVEAVQKGGGEIYYTNDLVFSSSSLINRYLDTADEEIKAFTKTLQKDFTLDNLLDKLEELRQTRVMIVGDAIIDEYQYVEPLGQSGKGLHMTALCKTSEQFLGGSLIIANHVAEFADDVTLITSMDPKHPMLKSLSPKVKRVIVPSKETLTKKRYVMRDGETLTKLFETYSMNSLPNESEALKKLIQEEAQDRDLALICDFGNGLISPDLADELSKLPCFKAVNTQVNSGNRGFNVVTRYSQADFVSLNEVEVRLAAHDRYRKIDAIAKELQERLKCSYLSVTQGVRGMSCFEKERGFHVPALMTHAIDRVGAGDSYLSLAALSLAKKHPFEVAAFFGSLAAAMDVQIVGNKEPVKKIPLKKFLTRLYK